MPPPRIPRFRMPALSLPPVPEWLAPGTPLPATQARLLSESLSDLMAELFLLKINFRRAWEAHYTQHGQKAPALDVPARRRQRPLAPED
jgi:hypothetical protein